LSAVNKTLPKSFSTNKHGKRYGNAKATKHLKTSSDKHAITRISSIRPANAETLILLFRDLLREEKSVFFHPSPPASFPRKAGEGRYFPPLSLVGERS
jgi:hypothetical protein